jgi:hypothetical protein
MNGGVLHIDIERLGASKLFLRTFFMFTMLLLGQNQNMN